MSRILVVVLAALLGADAVLIQRNQNDGGPVPQDKLRHACRNGDSTFVGGALGDPAAASDRRKWGECFRLACRHCHIDVVRLLVDDPAIDPDAKGPDGSTGFHHACRDHYRLAAAAAADLDESYGAAGVLAKVRTLYRACPPNKVDIVRLLLGNPRVDVSAKTGGGWTGFQEACASGNAGAVRLLLGDGRFDVNAKDGAGSTALHIACSPAGSAEVVRLLLADRRVDVNARNGAGQTALHDACRNGRADIVRLLLADPRVDVGARDNDGATGFPYASLNGHADVVQLLLAHPRAAEAFLGDGQGPSGLVAAVLAKKPDLVGLLLGDARIDPNGPNGGAFDAMLAALIGLDGPTAFVVACYQGLREVVDLLLADKRVDADAVDAGGDTGLVHACRQGHGDVVRDLLDRTDRVDMTIRNKAGESAADVGPPEIRKLVQAKLDEIAARKRADGPQEKEAEILARGAEPAKKELAAKKSELELKKEELELQGPERALRKEL